MSDIYKLDGSEKVKPVPFDAHEQATRGEHIETTKDSPDRAAHLVAEYPKVVEHTEKGDEAAVIVNSAEEEAAYHAGKAAE